MSAYGLTERITYSDLVYRSSIGVDRAAAFFSNLHVGVLADDVILLLLLLLWLVHSLRIDANSCDDVVSMPYCGLLVNANWLLYGAILNGIDDEKNDEVGYDELYAEPTCALVSGNGGHISLVVFFESLLLQISFSFKCFIAFIFSLCTFSFPSCTFAFYCYSLPFVMFKSRCSYVCVDGNSVEVVDHLFTFA